MYRLGHQIRHRHGPLIISGLIVIGCIAAAVVLLPRILKSNTTLVQSSPVTRHITLDTAVQRVAEPTFRLSLPSGWHAVTPSQAPSRAYSWVGMTADGAGRRLDVYIDQIPATLAVNRLLPVRPSGAQFNTAGMVSDNCVNFTDRATESVATGTALAKWNGVNFLCDMGNYERDVVAIGSTEGINTVTLTGNVTGRHQVLLVYTDNSIEPDYAVFTAIVQSFTLL